jgi:uncharacterized protein YjbI with pentapeptide repeats
MAASIAVLETKQEKFLVQPRCVSPIFLAAFTLASASASAMAVRLQAHERVIANLDAPIFSNTKLMRADFASARISPAQFINVDAPVVNFQRHKNAT